VISAIECKEARRLLGWTQQMLAHRLGVSPETIGVFERGDRIPWALDQTELRRVFETARIAFDTSEVRIRRPGAL
jgi:DNA-binding XRE family transcriptional regulator